MALYIPTICPKCFESVTLIQPQYKGGAFKGPALRHVRMDEREYDLTVAANSQRILTPIVNNG